DDVGDDALRAHQVLQGTHFEGALRPAAGQHECSGPLRGWFDHPQRLPTGCRGDDLYRRLRLDPGGGPFRAWDHAAIDRHGDALGLGSVDEAGHDVGDGCPGLHLQAIPIDRHGELAHRAVAANRSTTVAAVTGASSMPLRKWPPATATPSSAVQPTTGVLSKVAGRRPAWASSNSSSSMPGPT